MHDAHRRPIGWSPAQRRRRHVPPSLLSTSRFSPRRPAGRPFQLPFAFAEPALCRRPAHSYSYELHRPGPVPSPFALVKSFLPCPPIGTLVFIGGSCGLLLQSACMGASHFQHDSGIIFLYQPCSLAIASTVQEKTRVWQPFSRHSFCSSETFFYLSPSTDQHQLRSHFRLSSVTGFK